VRGIIQGVGDGRSDYSARRLDDSVENSENGSVDILCVQPGLCSDAEDGVEELALRLQGHPGRPSGSDLCDCMDRLIALDLGCAIVFTNRRGDGLRPLRGMWDSRPLPEFIVPPNVINEGHSIGDANPPRNPQSGKARGGHCR